MLTDSVVTTQGLNFPTGRWGTCMNGQTFQQEALVSYKGWQYAALFEHGGGLAVARRRLPDGVWEVIRFTDYPPVTHGDVHNVAVIGIAPGDGSIHLAFDHHVSPLHYRRSLPGLASDPAAHAWTAAAFGPITDRLQPDAPLTRLTYPQFIATPEGRLQLLYRIGYSGNGDWFLEEYDPADAVWRHLGLLFAAAGNYGTSSSRCAYPNPLRYGPDGRLHITWSWREQPAGVPFSLATNHDLMYASSADRGRTWLNSAGEEIASLGGGAPRAISIETPGILVVPMRFLWGQMNTTTQCIDRQDRVHVVAWRNPEEAPAASLDKSAWRYDHCWREVDGTWHVHRLPFTGRKPQIAIDRLGTAYVIACHGEDHNYQERDPGGVLRIATATAASGWNDWRFLPMSDRRFVGEALLDPMRWNEEGILSIYIQEQPVAPGLGSPLHVVELKPDGPLKPVVALSGH